MNQQATSTADKSISGPERDTVVRKALMNVGKMLDIAPDVLGAIVGRNKSSLYRANGLKADSKHGELALVLIRCYRALYALMGGNEEAMRHWFHTHNHHTAGVPIEQVQSLEGLMSVSRYLDGIRGKI